MAIASSGPVPSALACHAGVASTDAAATFASIANGASAPIVALPVARAPS